MRNRFIKRINEEKTTSTDLKLASVKHGVKFTHSITPKKEPVDLNIVLEKYFQECFIQNLHMKLDDIVVGSGDSVDLIKIEHTFIDLKTGIEDTDNLNSPAAMRYLLSLRNQRKINDMGYFDEPDFLRLQSDSHINNGFVRHVLNWECASGKHQKSNHISDDSKDNTKDKQENDLDTKYASKRNFILRGKAGQGKSTLMQYIAIVNWAAWLKENNVDFMLGNCFLTSSETQKLMPKDFMPRITFKISLALYDKYIAYLIPFIESGKTNIEVKNIQYYLAYLLWCYENKCNPFGIKSSIEEKTKLEEWIDDPNIETFGKMMQELLKKERVLVLFDGLDEVKLKRKIVIEQIIDFVKIFTLENDSNVLSITTTREEKANEISSGNLFTEYVLRELDRDSVQECVKKFFSAKLGRSSLDIANKIMIYYDKEEYQRIMQTPLEVIMVCMVYNCYQEVPKSIVDLYNTYINMYIQREKRKPAAAEAPWPDFWEKSYTVELINDFLNRVGYELEYGQDFIPKKRAILIAKEVNTDNDGDQRNEINDDAFFSNLVDAVFTRLDFFDEENGGDDSYYTLDNQHASVKEFLAARYFVENRSDEEILKYVQKVVLEQENNARHWGIFCFMLKLVMNRDELAKNILRRLQLNCCDVYESDIYKIPLENLQFGAKIAEKLIFEDDNLKTKPNCKKYLYTNATKILLLDTTPDSNGIYRLLEECKKYDDLKYTFLFIESKLSAKFISRNILEAIAYINFKEIPIDMVNNPNLAKYVQSQSIYDLVLCDFFERLPFSHYEDNRFYSSSQFLVNFIDKAINREKGLNISFDPNIPLICKQSEQFYLVELIRGVFIERPFSHYLYSYCSELFDGKKIEPFDDTPISDFSSWNKLTLCEIKNEGSTLLDCYLSLYDDKDFDKQSFDEFVVLCDKYNLYGCSELFKCIGMMTKENFLSFAKNLYSGKYDQEFSAVFGSKEFFDNLNTYKYRVAHPAFIIIRNRLSKGKPDFSENDIAKLWGIIEGKKFKLSINEVLFGWENGFPFKIILANSSNNSHKKLLKDVWNEAGVLKSFLFAGLEWRGLIPITKEKEGDDEIFSTYQNAIDNREYSDLRNRLITLITPGDIPDYTRIAVLNFLLASCANFPKEYPMYTNFDIGKYNNIIEHEMCYRFTKKNKVIMQNNQYDLKNPEIKKLFHGCEAYKSMLRNLASLAEDSNEYFVYFKRAFCLLLASDNFILTFGKSDLWQNLRQKYQTDAFISFIDNLCKWGQSDDSDQCELMMEMLTTEICRCVEKKIFTESVSAYLILTRFIFNNFNPEEKTCKLIRSLLNKIPTDGRYGQVRAEIEDYFSLLLKKQNFSVIENINSQKIGSAN